MVDRLGASLVGESGLSSLGAVVGATAPEHIERLRAAMPRAVFLIPGVGAQGGKVEDLAAAFTAGSRRGADHRLARARQRVGRQAGSDPVPLPKRQPPTSANRSGTVRLSRPGARVTLSSRGRNATRDHHQRRTRSQRSSTHRLLRGSAQTGANTST